MYFILKAGIYIFNCFSYRFQV